MKLFGEEYFGIISAILTLLILVLSEIIPKTIGASYWRIRMPSPHTSTSTPCRVMRGASSRFSTLIRLPIRVQVVSLDVYKRQE